MLIVLDTVFLVEGPFVSLPEGACNVLYAFDVSEYGSQRGCVLPNGALGWERCGLKQLGIGNPRVQKGMAEVAYLVHLLISFRYSQVVHTPCVRNSSWGPGWTFGLCPGQDHVHFWGL